MRHFLMSDLYTPNMYAELIVEVANQLKNMDPPSELNYDQMVQEIAQWFNDLLGLRMPKLSVLVGLVAGCFALVMKAKRMKIDVDNYEFFVDHLRADVYRELFGDIKDKDLGIKTKYEIKK